MLKIRLKNPITEEEISTMIRRIVGDLKPNVLLIDFGAHDFESLAVLRFCKDELKKIEPNLLQFRKIAMLSVPPYQGEPLLTDRLKYFHSEKKAMNWLSAAAGKGTLD